MQDCNGTPVPGTRPLGRARHKAPGPLVVLPVHLFVCLSVVNFIIRHDFLTVGDRDFIILYRIYVLSNITRINGLVILSLTSLLKWVIFCLCCHRKHNFSQKHLVFIQYQNWTLYLSHTKEMESQ